MSSAIRMNGKGRAVYEAVLDELAAVGLPKPVLKKGGKHFYLVASVNGRQRKITLPASPSDPDACHVKRGDVRRLLRSEGLLR